MANLIFKGHATRGKELHKLLEHLGGVDCGYSQCCCATSFYYINREGYIEGSSMIPDYMKHRIIMSLEAFESAYPYKVGDKVTCGIYVGAREICEMKWDSDCDCVKYGIGVGEWFTASLLQPYKEETMEKEISGAIIDRFICLEGFEFYDDKGNIINTKEIIMKKKKPQYPKTYKECFNICFGNKHHIVQVVGLDGLGDNKELFESFIKLKICRDAYWKIAGEQMGLGKPWEHDMSNDKFSYAISYQYGHIQKNEIRYKNTILAFPTAEMRDAFYENFKELIESCKELL